MRPKTRGGPTRQPSKCQLRNRALLVFEIAYLWVECGSLVELGGEVFCGEEPEGHGVRAGAPQAVELVGDLVRGAGGSEFVEPGVLDGEWFVVGQGGDAGADFAGMVGPADDGGVGFSTDEEAARGVEAEPYSKGRTLGQVLWW